MTVAGAAENSPAGSEAGWTNWAQEAAQLITTPIPDPGKQPLKSLKSCHNDTFPANLPEKPPCYSQEIVQNRN
jgi:hypothetical protein